MSDILMDNFDPFTATVGVVEATDGELVEMCMDLWVGHFDQDSFVGGLRHPAPLGLPVPGLYSSIQTDPTQHRGQSRIGPDGRF